MEILAYRDRETGAYPISEADARLRVSDRLFGSPLSEDDLDLLGVDPVFASPRPEVDATTHVAREGVIVLVGGFWRQGWLVDLLPPPEPVVTVVYKLDLFERTTEAEADAIMTAIDEQPVRTVMIFESAQSFRSDHPLWTLLHDAAVQLFGAERAAELLAPSL